MEMRAMIKKTHIRLKDVRGLSRLALDATLGITGIVESMHTTIAGGPGLRTVTWSTRGVTGLVYRSIRGVTRMVAGGLDAALGAVRPWHDERPSSLEREAVLAALNGVLGDHLLASGNPLALPMRLRLNGVPLEISPESLSAAIPAPTGKILVLAHGLCMNDLQWLRNGHDHGAALAAEFGFTPVYLHYNSGLHISHNGQMLADLLETLLAGWPVPVEQLTLLCHSMGGLVARSAYHAASAADYAWPRQLHKLVFLSTPHYGSPLERIGNWVDRILDAMPYTAALSRIGKIRSAGVTDLRHASLLAEDWQDRDRFVRSSPRSQLPLPAGVRCYTVGVTLGRQPGDVRDRLLGDGLVPLASALGIHPSAEHALPFDADQRWVGYQMNHLDVLDRPEVYAQLRQWLAD
jgi:hypothetical protein